MIVAVDVVVVVVDDIVLFRVTLMSPESRRDALDACPPLRCPTTACYSAKKNKRWRRWRRRRRRRRRPALVSLSIFRPILGDAFYLFTQLIQFVCVAEKDE